MQCLIAALSLLVLPHRRLARQQAPAPGASPEDTAWVCPMHPDYTTDVGGKCPRCGMALVRAAPFDVRDYRLDFRTVPAGREAGPEGDAALPDLSPRQRRADQEVRDRCTRGSITSSSSARTWSTSSTSTRRSSRTARGSIEVTLPKAGYYKVLSDFLPSGGASQFIARPLVTAGYAGDLAADSAHLVPDTVLTKTVDDITATRHLDPPTFVVGLYGHLNFHLTDTATGRPITDLQTYLGAFGHTLIMSEDMVDYVHSHPLDILASRTTTAGRRSS